ncbi:upstream-binding factor 1-like protein 1 [Hipposideros larvatus]
MALPESQDHWCKEDVVQLLECMENNLPSHDSHTFKTTQSQMAWEKVAFKDYSGEMCKLKWLEISYSLRKIRTLKELVLEAKERVKNSYKRKKRKNHPDLPKKPLTSYLRFFKEKRLQYSQKHPELNNQELTKVLSKEYKALPEQRKLKYIQDFQKEKQEFEEKLAQFRKDHPDLVQNSKKSVISKRSPPKAQKKFQGNVREVKSPPENYLSEKMEFSGEPKKPPMNEYHKFYQDLWSSQELQDLPLRERMVEIGRRWQRVPQSQKGQYKKQAEELQAQYKVDLAHWLRSLSPEEYAVYRERTYTKRENMNMNRGPHPKIRRTDLQTPETESSEAIGSHSNFSQGSEEDKEDGGKVEGRSSLDSCNGDEDEESEPEDGGSDSSSPGDTYDSDSD